MKMLYTKNTQQATGFTIVELLVVIVVIGILAVIAVVAYSGIQQRAAISILQADLSNTRTQLGIDRASSDSETYPDDIDNYKHNENVTLEYTTDGDGYCVTASSSQAGISYNLDSTTGEITEGACDGHTGAGGGGIADGDFIQEITSANCPTTRTRAVDARDNHTYWVQELADGKCWMLTNLAYAGGGTDTYGDVKSLTNGGTYTYTAPRYYVVPSTTNFTTEPTAPSTSTDGTGQYGYLYNWCGAMGGQTSTSACANGTSPLPDTATSVCPDGWRLPTGNGGEFGALNTSVNGGSTTSNTGLRTSWLGQYGGSWAFSSFSGQGERGLYWSSTQASATNTRLLSIYADPEILTNPDVTGSGGKASGFAIRCVAI